MEQYDKMTTGNLIDAARREAVELDGYRATAAEKRLSGLLDALADRLEPDVPNRPLCLACKRQVDFLEPNGLCCPCDLAASEQSTGGNRGY